MFVYFIMKTVSLILAMITLTLNIFYLSYVYNLEVNDCTCSEDWRRDFIKYYSMILILKLIIMIFLLNKKNKNKIVMTVLKVLVFLTGLGNLLYVYSLLTYAHKLRKKTCECSEHTIREIMYWFSLVNVTITVVVMFIGLLAFNFLRAYRLK